MKRWDFCTTLTGRERRTDGAHHMPIYRMGQMPDPYGIYDGIGTIFYWAGCLLSVVVGSGLGYLWFNDPVYQSDHADQPGVLVFLTTIPFVLGWIMRALTTANVGISLRHRVRARRKQDIIDQRKLDKKREKDLRHLYLQFEKGKIPRWLLTWRVSLANKKVQIYYGAISCVPGFLYAFEDYVLWEDNIILAFMFGVMVTFGAYVVYALGVLSLSHWLLNKFLDSGRVEPVCMVFGAVLVLAYVYCRFGPALSI